MRSFLLHFTALVLPAVLLAGCSYFIDTSNQQITVRTPGATSAVCYLNIDGLRYRVQPPKPVTVSKSEKDLVVDCLAPGNRRKSVVVEATLEDSAKYNVANAGVGLPWDYASKAMFTYPEIIDVDFTQSKPTPEALPAQNNPDVKQPEEYRHEEIRPGLARMNADKNLPPIEIRTRGTNAPTPLSDNDAFTESVSETGDGKGNLESVLESYGGAINPSDSAPTPLIPGE